MSNKEGKTVLYLVFEYMDTDLKKFLRSFRQNGESIPPKTIKLCKGVAFCHGHGVLHRDLKPHNLLMDRKTSMLKIADLGLARSFTLPIKKYTHEILTLWYRAPEVLLGATHYSTAVDMWSVGCIFAELVTEQAIFAGDSELQQLLHIFRLLGTPNGQVWPGVSKLVNWHEYPQWKPQQLSSAVPNLDENGLNLLAKPNDERVALFRRNVLVLSGDIRFALFLFVEMLQMLCCLLPGQSQRQKSHSLNTELGVLVKAPKAWILEYV
nr:cyclin-dependent kinase B2-2 [Ipomoea batatas]